MCQKVTFLLFIKTKRLTAFGRQSEQQLYNLSTTVLQLCNCCFDEKCLFVLQLLCYGCTSIAKQLHNYCTTVALVLCNSCATVWNFKKWALFFNSFVEETICKKCFRKLQIVWLFCLSCIYACMVTYICWIRDTSIILECMNSYGCSEFCCMTYMACVT